MHFRFFSFILLLLSSITVFGETSTCEDEVTFDMKFKLIKDSLERVKGLYPKCKDPEEDLAKCGKKEMALAHMNLALDTLKGFKVTPETKDCPKCPDPQLSRGPMDCQEVLKKGNFKSGVYTIYPKSRINETMTLRVYCDMTTDGGGWTVIQRRGSYAQIENFHRGWKDYKNGFGSIERDFWLGNDNIYTLTHQGVYSLRIDMRNKQGEYRYSRHDGFWIGNEASAYAIRVRDFSGNVSNDLSTQDGRRFTTKDRQNDGHSSNDACTDEFHGAWWYSQAAGCGSVNLNGLFIPGVYNKHSNWWFGWTKYTGLAFSEMKIRHRSPEF